MKKKEQRQRTNIHTKKNKHRIVCESVFSFLILLILLYFSASLALCAHITIFSFEMCAQLSDERSQRRTTKIVAAGNPQEDYSTDSYHNAFDHIVIKSFDRAPIEPSRVESFYIGRIKCYCCRRFLFSVLNANLVYHNFCDSVCLYSVNGNTIHLE